MNKANGNPELLSDNLAVYDNLPLGIYVYMLDNFDKDKSFRLIYANSAAYELTGIANEEVIGKNIDDCFPGLKRLEVKAFPIGDNCVGVMFQNVTSRKKDEEELLYTKAQLLEAQEFAHLGYWELEARNGKYSWSDELFRMLGFKSQEFRPTLDKFIELIHSDDKEFMTNVIKNPIHVKERELEFRIITQDNKMIWIHEKIKYDYDVFGKEIRRYGVALDITQRKLSELKLKESEEKFREVAENLGEVIWVRQNGQLVYISQAYEKVWGKSCQSLYENPDSFIDSVHPDDKEGIRQKFLAENDITSSFGDQYKIIRPDGTIRWIWSRKYPIFDENGALIRLLGISEDITEIKEYEESLRQAIEKAEEANMAKSQFLANMSHEIRTPMNGVMGTLQLLEMTHLNEEQAELLNISRTSTELLLKVINDILDYSKIEARKLKIEKRQFDLKQIINEIIDMFKPSIINKKIALDASIDENVPLCFIGDSFKLKQILINLIGNAIKFTPEGRINVKIRMIEELPNSEIKLEWVVQDTGIGLSPNILEDIFNSFCQGDNSTTREYGGTGLGLSICKGLVELMQGEIWVERKEGEGSCFYFTCILEKYEEEDNQCANALKNVKDIIKEDSLKLLVVEDDAISRMVIEKLASRKGWQVIPAENGNKAIEAYRHNNFDAILMDVQMPVLDGYQTTRAIRQLEIQNGSYTPIIAMTAYALEGDREKCLESGMDDYLSKPIDADRFYALVEKWN